MLRSRIPFAALFLALFVSACTQAIQPVDGPATDSPTASGFGYPAGTPIAVPSLESAYPGGVVTPTTEPPPPTPTADPGLGIVSGVLLLRGQPVTNYAIYLAEVIKDSGGAESVVALDLTTSPSGITGADGAFRIVNVAPGAYGLILVTVKDSYHLLYPDQQESLIVRVEPAGHIDLGSLDYQALPIVSP